MRSAGSRISVVITSYNQKEYLVGAIAGVLEQTLPPVVSLGRRAADEGVTA